MKKQMSPRDAYYLKVILNSIPSKELGSFRGNKYRAMTSRRKVVDALEDANEIFEERLKSLQRVQQKYFNKQKKARNEFMEEMQEEREESEDDTLPKSEAVEKKQEFREYMESISENMNQEIRDELGLRTLTAVVGDDETEQIVDVLPNAEHLEEQLNSLTKDEIQEKADKCEFTSVNKDEQTKDEMIENYIEEAQNAPDYTLDKDMIEVEFDEEYDQFEFVKTRFEEHAVDQLPVDNVVMSIADSLGLQE